MSTLRQRWKPLALLSIIFPVSLLVSFRLTGVLQGPPKPETITVEGVGWNMSRPSELKRIDELVNNSYTDSVVSINLVVEVFDYYENSQGWAGFDVV